MHIMAGQFKGRKLLPPKGSKTTRPITALARKSLFGMLEAWLPDAVVLDLFAGTGTIGIEALSRGAELCCFAERDGQALARLRRNIDTVGASGRCTVWGGDVYAGLAGRLKRLGRPVDVAFVDPPYAQSRTWAWPETIRQLFAPVAAVLAHDGLVVVRTGGPLVDVPPSIAGLVVKRVKRYGDMHITFLGFPETDDSEAAPTEEDGPDG